MSAETRAKLAAARRGKKMSAGHRAKLSSPEVRAKISATMTGRPLSPDHRAHITETQQLRYSREKSPNWRGDEAGYSAVHLRARKVLPLACALADDTCKGRLEVALRHGSLPESRRRFSAVKDLWYSTSTDDYWRLCRSHHVRYDELQLNLRCPLP